MGTLAMEKLIEDCPVFLTNNNTDEGKVVNMELLKKKSLGYYPLSDKMIIVALKGDYVIFDQDDIHILADYEDNEEVKKKLKNKRIIITDYKSFTFNNVKKKCKNLLINKVKTCSNSEIGAIEMYDHIKDFDDINETILEHLSAAKDKETKKLKKSKKNEKDLNSSKPKDPSSKSSKVDNTEDSKGSQDSKKSSNSSSSDTSNDDSSDSSSARDSNSSKVPSSQASSGKESELKESGSEKVITDEDEELNESSILTRKRMPPDKISSDRIERMTNTGLKLVKNLRRSLGELERSSRTVKMPSASSKAREIRREERYEKPKTPK